MAGGIPGPILYGFFVALYVLADITCIRFIEDGLWRHLAENAFIKFLLYAFAPIFFVFYLLTVAVRLLRANVFGDK